MLDAPPNSFLELGLEIGDAAFVDDVRVVAQVERDVLGVFVSKMTGFPRPCA